MSRLTARMIGGAELQRQLSEIAKRASPEGRTQIAAKIGQRVALDLMPRVLSENRGGWRSPSGYPRAYRAGGQALIDTGRLRQSWLYRASADSVVIGTGVPYAHALDKGATIRPRKQWLLLPLSPPLTRGEVVDWPKGEAAIRAKYPTSFFLVRGPEGPGIYRLSRVRTATKLFARSKAGAWSREARPSAQYAAKTKGYERIAAGRKKIVIKAHHFARVWPWWDRDLTGIAAAYVLLGSKGRVALTGGTLDVGPRG